MKNDLIKIKFSVEQKEALKKMLLQIKAAEASYGKEFESINDFLRVHGYIKPRDFDEFIWWLYLIKLKQEQLYPVPKITDTLFVEYHEYRKQNLLSSTNHKIEVQAEKLIIESKPVFTEEVKSFVFDVLKGFFDTQQQSELKRIIDTGAKANERLIFKGNGNQLTDTFSKLIRNNFIVGCEKKQLNEWIISSFVFVNKGKTSPFTPDYVEKFISRNGFNCKRPLIDIIDGKPQRQKLIPNKRRRKQ
jgi:hypothetical protein